MAPHLHPRHTGHTHTHSQQQTQGKRTNIRFRSCLFRSLTTRLQVFFPLLQYLYERDLHLFPPMLSIWPFAWIITGNVPALTLVTGYWSCWQNSDNSQWSRHKNNLDPCSVGYKYSDCWGMFYRWEVWVENWESIRAHYSLARDNIETAWGKSFSWNISFGREISEEKWWTVGHK